MAKLKSFLKECVAYLTETNGVGLAIFTTALFLPAIGYMMARFYGRFDTGWTRMENWAMFGDYIGGIGGLLISIVVLFWVMASVRIQREELKDLVEQQRIDRKIDDCRTFLELNNKNLDGHFNTKLSEKARQELQENWGAPKTLITFAHYSHLLAESKNRSQEKHSEYLMILARHHSEEIKAITAILEMHVKAMQDWVVAAKLPDNSLPNGVLYFAEYTMGFKNFVAFLGMCDSSSELIKFYKKARQQTHSYMTLSDPG